MERGLPVLTDLLSEAKSGDADLGSDALLERYQRQRRPDNVAMVAFTDILAAMVFGIV